MRTSFLGAVAGLAVLTAPLAAAAQAPPSYAQPVQPPYAAQDEQIHGRIASFDGQYSLQVHDDRGFLDNVQLHQGTIINPIGLTLAPGMIVAIDGYASGPYFEANEIDTPYQFYSGVPYYLGHPWFYYGPSISLGFFFGNTGWWRGGYRGGFGYDRGGYRGPQGVQQGGSWQGRRYVAPASRGGYVPHGVGRAPAGHSYGGHPSGGGGHPHH
jgi:hypothetical protein